MEEGDEDGGRGGVEVEEIEGERDVDKDEGGDEGRDKGGHDGRDKDEVEGSEGERDGV